MPATRFTLSILLASLAVALGCASTRTNPDLDRARAAYDQAVQSGVDPDASVDLYDASKDLSRAQSALSEGQSEEIVSHYAFLGETRVKIAVAAADTERARKKAAELAQERSQLRLKARTREAEMAEQKARVAQERAVSASVAAQQAEEREEQARAQAEQAQAQAQAAEQQLADLDARQTKRGLLLTLGGVLFEFGKADLKPEAKTKLARVAGFLIAAPNRDAAIEGYTDNVGSESYNSTLSRERAETVRDFLVANGVESTRLATAGYGPAYPVDSNESAEGRRRNRRVEILILKPGERAVDGLRQPTGGNPA
jgi:outer membrane protein OmpA-like peptidoglycan-associated protein